MWPYDLVFLVAGLFLLLLVWYFRGKRHSAIFAQLAPLLDAPPGEMQVAGPIRGGEDRVQESYRGRDLLLALKEPERGHETSGFRIILGSAMNMPFLISVQKRMFLGLVSQVQRGRAVKTGYKNMDRNFYVTNLTARTGAGFFQRMFGGAKISIALDNHLQKRLTCWLQLQETLASFETLFNSCGVDYLSTRVEYPGKIELPASKSGLTVVLRHYTKRQLRPENVGRILAEMEALLLSAENLLELRETSFV
jgi:hypothetical protein